MKNTKWITSLILSFLAIFLIWQGLSRKQVIPEPDVLPTERLQCASYSPFGANESPSSFLNPGFKISESRIDADLTLLSKRFDCVRTYSVTGLEAILPIAQRHGMQVMMGIWVNNDEIATEREIQIGLELVQKYRPVIRAVVVGNEVLLRKELTSRQLIQLIRRVKSQIGDLPVTYGDVSDFWDQASELGPAVDFVFIHLLPYWINDPVTIDDVKAYFDSEYSKIANRFPGKEVVIGETGWPSFGRMREGALPSLVNEARYIRGFLKLAHERGWRYNLFEAFDQPWKRLFEGAVGGHWGLYDKNRQDKSIFAGPVSNYPNGNWLCAVSLGLAIAGGLWFRRLRDFTSWREASGVAAIITTATVLLTLQGYEFLLTARTTPEFVWGFVEMFFFVLAFVLLLESLARRRCPQALPLSFLFSQFVKKSEADFFDRLYHAFFWGVSSLFCLETIGFVFDARYRSFPIWGFLVVAVCFFWNSTQSFFQKATDFLSEKSLALLLVLAGIFILCNETWRNWQSDLWGVILITWFYALWTKNGDRIFSFSQNAKKVFIFILKTSFLLALPCVMACLIRFRLMQSADVANSCSESPTLWFCTLRSQIGLLIHFRVFPFLSLLATVLSWLLSRSRLSRSLAWTGLMCSVFGLVLYNVETAGWTFLLGFLTVAEKEVARKI